MVKTIRAGDMTTPENPYVESSFFVPAAMIVTSPDKKLVKEYMIVGNPNPIPDMEREGGEDRSRGGNEDRSKEAKGE